MSILYKQQKKFKLNFGNTFYFNKKVYKKRKLFFYNSLWLLSKKFDQNNRRKIHINFSIKALIDSNGYKKYQVLNNKKILNDKQIFKIKKVFHQTYINYHFLKKNEDPVTAFLKMVEPEEKNLPKRVMERIALKNIKRKKFIKKNIMKYKRLREKKILMLKKKWNISLKKK